VFSLLVFGLQLQYPRINILLYPALWFINYTGFIFKFFLSNTGFQRKLPEMIFSKSCLLWY